MRSQVAVSIGKRERGFLQKHTLVEIFNGGMVLFAIPFLKIGNCFRKTLRNDKNAIG